MKRVGKITIRRFEATGLSMSTFQPPLMLSLQIPTSHLIIEPHFLLEDKSYVLKGIVYYNDAHYTCRFFNINNNLTERSYMGLLRRVVIFLILIVCIHAIHLMLSDMRLFLSTRYLR